MSLQDPDGHQETTEQWFVSGRVQGVSYRAFIKRKADELGLRGWVRNRSDRRVEVLVCGSGTSIDALLGAARQGPLLASVKTVCRQRVDELPIHQSFFVRETL